MLPNLFYFYFPKAHLYIIFARVLFLPLWFILLYTSVLPYNLVGLISVFVMVLTSGYLGTVSMMAGSNSLHSGLS